ncbi:MAG: hypothetical protein WCR02_05280 [Sphaerochaetaceae bacterium]
MARKSFLSSVFSALIFAVVIFFVIYFFAPDTSNRFLGTSYKYRKDKEVVLVQNAISSAMGSLGDFTQEQQVKLKKLLEDPKIRDSLKAAAGKGADVLKQQVKALLDEVK